MKEKIKKLLSQIDGFDVDYIDCVFNIENNKHNILEMLDTEICAIPSSVLSLNEKVEYTTKISHILGVAY